MSRLAVDVSAAAVVSSCSGTFLRNARFEGAAGTAAAGWCDSYGLGYVRTQVTPVKYNYVAQLSVSTSVPSNERYAGAFQEVVLNQTQPRTVFVGAMLRGTNIVLDGADGWGAAIIADFKVDCAAHPQFCAYNGINPTSGYLRCSTLPNFGTFDWRWIGLDSHTCGIGYVRGDGRWVDVPVQSLSIFPHVFNATGEVLFDLVQLRQFGPGRGAITFMFDDGPVSTWTQAKPALGTLPGSAAIVSSRVGRPGQLTAQNIRDLQAAGWDIVSHSVTHADLTTLTDAGVRRELVDSKSFLQSLGVTVDSHAWPFGSDDQRVVGIAQEGLPTAPIYRSTRSTDFGDNAYGTFPYMPRTLIVIDETSLADVDAWIADLKDDPSCTSACNGRWGILLFHDIIAGGTPNTYQNTRAFLDAVVLRARQSGLLTLNYRAGYQRFAKVSPP